MPRVVRSLALMPEIKHPQHFLLRERHKKKNHNDLYMCTVTCTQENYIFPCGFVKDQATHGLFSENRTKYKWRRGKWHTLSPLKGDGHFPSIRIFSGRLLTAVHEMKWPGYFTWPIINTFRRSAATTNLWSILLGSQIDFSRSAGMISLSR